MPVDQDFDDHNRAATRYQSSYVSPWTNRFYSPSLAVPGPSNYYLPVATPHEYTQFIVRPYQPWMRQVVNLPPSLLCASIRTLFMCGKSFPFFSCLISGLPYKYLPSLSFPSLYFLFLWFNTFQEIQSQLILCRFVVRNNVLILYAGHSTHTTRLVWMVLLQHLLTILIDVCLSPPAIHFYLSNNTTTTPQTTQPLHYIVSGHKRTREQQFARSRSHIQSCIPSQKSATGRNRTPARRLCRPSGHKQHCRWRGGRVQR